MCTPLRSVSLFVPSVHVPLKLSVIVTAFVPSAEVFPEGVAEGLGDGEGNGVGIGVGVVLGDAIGVGDGVGMLVVPMRQAKNRPPDLKDSSYSLPLAAARPRNPSRPLNVASNISSPASANLLSPVIEYA
jgi:hypothetical protein